MQKSLVVLAVEGQVTNLHLFALSSSRSNQLLGQDTMLFSKMKISSSRGSIIVRIFYATTAAWLCCISELLATAGASGAAPAVVKPEAEVKGMTAFLDSLKYDTNGLVSIVVQVRGGLPLGQAISDS